MKAQIVQGHHDKSHHRMYLDWHPHFLQGLPIMGGHTEQAEASRQ